MKSRKPENLNRIFPRWKICYLMKKLIHIRVQIIKNLNSGIHQNKKIKAELKILSILGQPHSVIFLYLKHSHFLFSDYFINSIISSIFSPDSPYFLFTSAVFPDSVNTSCTPIRLNGIPTAFSAIISEIALPSPPFIV